MDIEVNFKIPPWLVEFEKKYKNVIFDDDIESKMSIAINISKFNVLNNTGGPFGCAIFKVCKKSKKSSLFSLGCNLVTSYNNCTLHAETVAIQIGQKRKKNFTFNDIDYNFELYTSCEPCAMCLGAILWSGISLVYCGATKKDAEEIGFNEGPVFDISYLYLEYQGVKTVKKISNMEAKEVFNLYVSKNGKIYNSK
jgi:tRNA(Arg) A34 adenosine deaminase TadA